MDVETDCACIWDPEILTIDLYCHACQAWHKDIEPNDLVGHIVDEWKEPEPTGTTTTFTVPEPDIRFVSKCRHFNNPLEFPDGTTVYPSSCHDRTWDAPAPDFGLYLDACWSPSCLAYLLDWPDMGIPYKWDVAADAIIDTFKKAKNLGMWVEIGCIGGHGRTGTVLACMAVLAGLSHKQAIKYVRKNYCEKAIEAREQEWFVEWFDKFINGGSTSPEPIWTRPKKGASYWAEGDVYTYNEPFDWQGFDPNEHIQGTPPKEIVETGYDQYFSITYYNDSGAKKYKTVYDTDPSFPELYAWVSAQETKKKETVNGSA
jgi:hypothetical protein